jgi:hypothetical protein
MDRHYSTFTHHVDNAKESITAEHLNVLGKAINDVEKNIVEISEESFVDKALFVLENNKYVNAMFVDEMENAYKIFKAKSTNIVYDNNECSVRVEDSASIKEGVVQSVYFTPQNAAPITKVILMADDYVPKGAKIEYFISTNGSSFFPIKPNQSEPIDLVNNGQGIFMKAKLTKNKAMESPKIFGWATFYKDTIIEKMYGITNVDLSRYDNNTETTGDTIITRDPLKGDKVVSVIDPESSTELYYDDKGRLDYIIERIGDRVIKEKMNYGQYYNSNGQYDDVLLSTTKSLINEESKTGDVPDSIMNLDLSTDTSGGGTP